MTYRDPLPNGRPTQRLGRPLTPTRQAGNRVSLDAQDWVWNHSTAKGTARLVILAVADKAGPDCAAFAGTTFLIKASNSSRSSVIRAIDDLLGSGEMEIVSGRVGRHGETRYRLPRAVGHRRAGGIESIPVSDRHRYQNDTPRGTKSTPGGYQNETPTGIKTTPHNAVERSTDTVGTQRERAGASEHDHRPPSTALTRPDGLTAIPDDFALTDAMRRTAASTFPQLDVDFETAQFISHYRSTGARRRNWPEQWTKWMRDSAKRLSERATRAAPAAMQPSTADLRVAQAQAGRTNGPIRSIAEIHASTRRKPTPGEAT